MAGAQGIDKGVAGEKSREKRQSAVVNAKLKKTALGSLSQWEPMNGTLRRLA